MIRSSLEPDPQLTLDLRPAPRWGGRRAGAGRKPSARRRVPHLPRARFTAHEPCHVTLRVRRGLPSLRDGRLVREITRSFSLAADQGAFRVVQFSLQRDHIHLLVEAEGPEAIGARIARAVHRVFRRRGRVLEERYHHRVIRTPRQARNVLVYVLGNFKKHASHRDVRHVAAVRSIDPASSGAWFEGWTRPLSPGAGPRPVAAARSWLLHRLPAAADRGGSALRRGEPLP